MACFPTLKGSQRSLESQRSLATDQQLGADITNIHCYLAPTSNKNTCDICGAALLGEEDQRFCHVCNKVLCVCCSEMQEKLLFMRNDRKTSRGDNCPLCDLLHSISGGGNISQKGRENFIPYQNHDDVKQSIPTEAKSARIPPMLDKVTAVDSRSANNVITNSTVVESTNDRSNVKVSNSLDTERSNVKIAESSRTVKVCSGDSLIVIKSEQSQGSVGESVTALDSGLKDEPGAAFSEGQGHQRGTTQNKDQGHKQGTTPDKDQSHQRGTTPDKGQGHQRGTTPDKDQSHQRGTTPDKDQGHQRGTTPDKDQGHQRGTTPDKGQGHQRGTTPDKGQGHQRGTTSDKDQGHQRGTTPDKGQGQKLGTMTSGQGHQQGTTDPDKGQGHNLKTTQDKGQRDTLVTTLDRGQGVKLGTFSNRGYGDKIETMTTFQGDKLRTMTSGQVDNLETTLDRGEMDRPNVTSLIGHSQKISTPAEKADDNQTMSDKAAEVNIVKPSVFKQDDNTDDFDDDLEEVEYDNLRLKEYSERRDFMDTVFEGLLGEVKRSNTRHHPEQQARRPGMKVGLLMLTEPGEVTTQKDQYGRDRLTQQYRYRNILIVQPGNTPLGSEETSSNTASSQETLPHLTQESMPPLTHDPHHSNFQRLSKQSVTPGNHPGISHGQAPGNSVGLPEECASGDFSGIKYEHFSKHPHDSFPGVSRHAVSPARHHGVSDEGQKGSADTFQYAGQDDWPGESVTPVYGEGSPHSTDPGSSHVVGKAGRSTSMVTQKRSRKRKEAFAHACSGCGRRDCEGNFMKLLREMIVTAGTAGFEIRNVIPDGNCMFAAIVDQLELKKDFSFSPKSLRHECLNFLRENPESDDGTPYALFLDAETWDEYLSRMSQDGEWGDHMILQAISQVTKRHIQVIHHDAERDWTVIENRLTPSDKSDNSDCLFLGHVGEFHYVSLRPSDLAKQLHNKEDAYSDDENFRSIDVFTSLPSLPNFDDPAKQEMFEEDYFDPWSEIPAVHLSYILKKFVPLTTTLQSADSMVANAEMMTEEGQMNDVKKHFGIGMSSSVVLVGDAAEGLYAPYLNERERTEFDQGSEWVDVTGLVMPNNCIAYPKDHSDVGEMDALIETEDVHPGYARLLSRYPDQWGMASSGAGVMTCYLPSHHSNFNKAFNLSKEEKDYSASQNPSVVSFFNKISMAIIAPFWPAVADEWRTRQRKAKWPSEKIINNVVSGGYHFECFPHPNSKNPDIEFHVCFSVAEKILAQEALSREQRYIFLVFKALCSQEFTEDELITSAHLKSIFFYACEQIPCDIWVSRPGSCIFYLLEALFMCIHERNVPDYFLPANNLIDHFDEDQHKRVLQKIMTLRNEPMTYLLKIGQKNHIYNAHSILSQVNANIELFHDHHSARRSVLEALVPISIDIAKYNLHTGAYKQALEQLQEAYEERLTISTCEDALPFTAFLTQATDGCTVEKQWWFFLNVDQQLHTTLCADLSMAMQPVALEELVGKDVAQTFVGTLIPAVMAHKLCRFCSDMAVHLYTTYHTQKCLPFLLFNLNRYREKLQRLALSSTHGQQHYYPGNRQPISSEDEDDYTDENALRVFNQLYIVYHRLNQLWIFQDLLPEFENVCDIINTRQAFSKLVTVLKQMGLTERAQMAEARRNSIPRETTRSGYLDNSNAYY